jgi:hypothetical protein
VTTVCTGVRTAVLSDNSIAAAAIIIIIIIIIIMKRPTCSMTNAARSSNLKILDDVYLLYNS